MSRCNNSNLVTFALPSKKAAFLTQLFDSVSATDDKLKTFVTQKMNFGNLDMACSFDSCCINNQKEVLAQINQNEL